jgi:NAD(P)-dependent dehydrogenase (short-subunit alcohol dehydrogenase family)
MANSTPTARSRPALLAGKTCLVSGVGPGLGRQVAKLLAEHGADLVLAARRQGTLDDVAAEVGGTGARVVTVPTDITDPSQCERLVATADAELGGIDVLVNNAFRFDVLKTFEDVDLDAWRKIMETNLFGSLQLTRAALPLLRRRQGGSVVMVASMAARVPPPLQGGYAISKGALLTATRVLASELGPSGIRVNAVVPGWMWGPSVEMYVDMASSGRSVPRSEVIGELEARIPLGRVPTDAEVAGTVVYLASDLSAAVTGQALDANGGEHFG